MKIKPEHYNHMKEELSKVKYIPLAVKIHEESPRRYKDFDKRLRWDAFYAANLSTWACDNIYSYANDDHIDTALRAIMKELGV